jgi:hypothetical protein
MRRRLFWLTLLLAIWLFCSGQAQAGELADRVQAFPDWQRRPTLSAAQGDLSYPDWMEGTWTLTTTLEDMVAPLAPAVVTPGFEGNRQFLEVPVQCQVRFVSMRQPAQGFVPLMTDRHQVVADRAFNGLNLARAYLGKTSVKAVKVDPQNPNRQVTLLRGGSLLEATVTARGTERPSSQEYITVELSQQIFRGAAQPYLNQVETTTVYRNLGVAVQAEQFTAVYLSPQDANFLTAPKQPVALYRYQLELRPSEPGQ